MDRYQSSMVFLSPVSQLTRQQCRSVRSIPQAQLDRPHLRTLASFQFKFAELRNESVHFVSFCTMSGRGRLLAVASETSLCVYRLQLDNLEQLRGRIPREVVCRFNFDSGRLLTDLAWSPETHLRAKVELLVALSDGTVSLCKWVDDPTGQTGGFTNIEHLAKHEGGGVSVHVSPKLDLGRAVSTGADNIMNVYETQECWEISEKRWLRSAGKFVRFIDEDIVLHELDGTIRMYEAFSARPLRVSLYKSRLPLRVTCTDTSFASVAQSGVLRVFDVPIWHPPTLVCKAAHNEEGKNTACLCIAISSTTPWAAIGDAGGYYVQNTHTGEIVQRSPTRHPVRHLSWHPEMTLLAITCGGVVQLFYLKLNNQ